MIEKLLIQAKTKAAFLAKLEAGEIQQLSIAFIEDTKEIWTHGIYYPCPYSKEEILNLISLSETGTTEQINQIKLTIDNYTVNGKKISQNPTITKADVGLSSVDNTSDANKPVSTAQLTALDKKADKTAVISSFSGKTGAITLDTGASNGQVNFVMSGNKLTGTVTGLKSAAYTDSTAYAQASHTHEIANVNGLQGSLDAKATKIVALKSVTGKAAADGSKVTVTLTTTTESGATQTPTIVLPAAADATQGTVTLNKVKELAKQEAAIAAGSTYKVRGTKATIDEVLAVKSATVGDVYNVTAEFTLNSKKYPAGTNVVFVGPAEEGEPDPSAQTQWDALGGTVDLSSYATISAMNSALANKADKNAVVSSFGGKTGAITVKGGGASNGAVNLTMSNNELQASIVGLKSAAFTDSSAYQAKGNYATKDGDLGNLKLKKMTLSEYDELGSKDANTLYIITD